MDALTTPATERAHSVRIEQAWIVDQNTIFTTLAEAQAYALGEAPASWPAHSVTIASNAPANGLRNIQGLLPELLASGPQDLRTAAALAQLAAQCLKLLEHRLPIFNHDYSDIVGHARWADEAALLNDENALAIYEEKWDTEPCLYLEKVSAPIYEFARDLECLEHNSNHKQATAREVA